MLLVELKICKCQFRGCFFRKLSLSSSGLLLALSQYLSHLSSPQGGEARGQWTETTPLCVSGAQQRESEADGRPRATGGWAWEVEAESCPECPFNSCWPGPAWRLLLALPPVQLWLQLLC